MPTDRHPPLYSTNYGVMIDVLKRLTADSLEICQPSVAQIVEHSIGGLCARKQNVIKHVE